MNTQSRARLRALGFVLLGTVASCGGDSTSPLVSGFLGGTADNRQVGVVVNALDKSVTLFQLGNPTNQQHIALGTSSTVTPTGLVVRGRRAAVPLGNAGSIALINLETATVQRYFAFSSGNATGSAFADDTTIIAANMIQNVVGRATLNQASDAITATVAVAAQPTAIAVANGRVLVISANLDANYLPIGNGVVTAIDPKTMRVLGTATTGGTNSTDGAMGPDGLLYVVNTGDYFTSGSLTIVNPATMAVVTTIPNIGVAPGAIYIDQAGLAYISSYDGGTMVFNTATRSFVRGPSNSVCAKLSSGACRGAFAATTNANGDLYQAFFGSASQGLAPYIFVFKASTFALTDSIAVGSGPAALAIRTF